MLAELEKQAVELDDAFARASRSIADNLGKAAAQGEVSFKRMTANVLSDLARLAIDKTAGQIAAPTGSKGIDLFGAAVIGLSGGNVTVNMQVHGVEASDFARSKGQVTQSLAQAVSDGMRRL